MANREADDIVKQIAEITGQYGDAITVTRTIKAATPTPNIFGHDTSETTDTFQATVIVEDLSQKLEATIAGAKNIERLSMITEAGLLRFNDELTYRGNKYLVSNKSPVNFAGTDVVELVDAMREVS